MTLTITAISNPEYPEKSIQNILDTSYNYLGAKFIVIQDRVFQKVAEIILFDGEQNHGDIMREYCVNRGNTFLGSGKVKKILTNSEIEFDTDTKNAPPSLEKEIELSIDEYSKKKGIFHNQHGQ